MQEVDEHSRHQGARVLDNEMAMGVISTQCINEDLQRLDLLLEAGLDPDNTGNSDALNTACSEVVTGGGWVAD